MIRRTVMLAIVVGCYVLGVGIVTGPDAAAAPGPTPAVAPSPTPWGSIGAPLTYRKHHHHPRQTMPPTDTED